MSKELQLYWDHCCHRNHQLKKEKIFGQIGQKGPNEQETLTLLESLLSL